MSFIVYLIVLAAVGLVVGALARLALPGKDPMSVGQTMLVGIAGSLIGGLPETQEMLDYCAEHQISSDVETIPIQQINEAYQRMLKNDVKYRFVIDMSSLH